MSKWVFWLLLVSALIIPIIGFSIFWHLRNKSKRIIAEASKQELSKTAYIPIAINGDIIEIARDTFWSVEELQFLLNTSKMNHFKNVLIYGDTSGLEGLMLSQQLNINVFVKQENLDKKEYDFYLSHQKTFNKPLKFDDGQKQQWDCVVFKPGSNYDLNDNFDKIWPQINPKGLVVIVNPDKKNKKKLLEYFKLVNIAHEYITNLNNKMILVTK